MKKLCIWAGIACAAPLLALAQDRISVTGTPIPQQLLVENYGKMPKGVMAYDLSICNVSGQKQSVVGSEIYQALANSNQAVTPIGRQIILASVLQNQSRSVGAILSATVGSSTSLVAVLGTSKAVNIPTGLSAALALGSLVLSQVTASLKPVLSPNNVLEKFDTDVLQAALVLDTGSCVERTMFALASKTAPKPSPLQFRLK
jgi:hypothetical protein